MHVAIVVLSVLLAVEFAFIGIIKVLATGTARSNAEHLGVSSRLSRMIGAAELVAVVGLLAGFALKPLTTVAAGAVVLLMAGAWLPPEGARQCHRAASGGDHGTGGRSPGAAHHRGVEPTHIGMRYGSTESDVVQLSIAARGRESRCTPT